MILTIFGIEILILFVIGIIIFLIAELLPYLIDFGLVALGIKLFYEFCIICIALVGHCYLYLSRVTNNLCKLATVDLQKRKSRRLAKGLERRSLKLVKQQFLISKKISPKTCIFIPKEILKEPYSRFKRNAVDIRGSRIDLARGKIEDCSYPVEQLSPISHKNLYRTFSDRERHLKQMAQSGWKSPIDRIYQAIKVQNNCFIVDSFSDVEQEVEQIEMFILDCQANRELYGNLAYKSFT